MTNSDQTSAPPPDAPRPIRELLRRDGPAMLGATVATLAVVLGVYLAGRAAGAGPPDATVASLAAGTLWLALASPILAAGGSGALSALVRGGIVADASGLALLVLWLLRRFSHAGGPCLTFLAAVEIYCTFVAIALVQVAAARCPRSPAWRYAAAILAAAIMAALLATPFWVTGPAGMAAPRTRPAIAAAAVYLNPFYSVTSAVVEQTGIVWHQRGALYDLSGLFEHHAPPPVPWYTAAVLYSLLAGILAATHLVRRPAPAAGR